MIYTVTENHASNQLLLKFNNVIQRWRYGKIWHKLKIFNCMYLITGILSHIQRGHRDCMFVLIMPNF